MVKVRVGLGLSLVIPRWRCSASFGVGPTIVPDPPLPWIRNYSPTASTFACSRFVFEERRGNEESEQSIREEGCMAWYEVVKVRVEGWVINQNRWGAAATRQRRVAAAPYKKKRRYEQWWWVGHL